MSVYDGRPPYATPEPWPEDRVPTNNLERLIASAPRHSEKPHAEPKVQAKLASLRVCASCEWIFKLPAPKGCPKCQFGHYGAHYVYGGKAYRYAVTQKPWFEKKMAAHSLLLMREIQSVKENRDVQRFNPSPL